MIGTEIHLISPGCIQPSLALQCRIISFHLHVLIQIALVNIISCFCETVMIREKFQHVCLGYQYLKYECSVFIKGQDIDIVSDHAVCCDTRFHNNGRWLLRCVMYASQFVNKETPVLMGRLGEKL